MKDLQVWMKLVEHLPWGKIQQLKVTGVNPNLIVGCAWGMSRQRSAHSHCGGKVSETVRVGHLIAPRSATRRLGLWRACLVTPTSLLRVAGVCVLENMTHILKFSSWNLSFRLLTWINAAGFDRCNAVCTYRQLTSERHWFSWASICEKQSPLLQDFWTMNAWVLVFAPFWGSGPSQRSSAGNQVCLSWV